MAETARFADADVPVCRSPEAARAVREYLRKATRLILETLGEDGIAAVAVSGSSTLGELTAVALAGEGPFILSDVDLALVTNGDAWRDRAKSARAELLRGFEAFPEAAGILPPAELGVYSLRDLEIQPRRMGILEMRTTSVTLWGDTGALDRLPAFGAEEIPKEESVVLIYNRCLELLHAYYSCPSDDSRGAMRLLYAAAKAFVDAGTALAAFHGAYAPGYTRRLHRLKGVMEKHHPGGLGALDAETLMEDFTYWTRFKVDPDLYEAAERYGCALDAAGLRETAALACFEARRTLIETWISLAGGGRAGAAAGALETCVALLGSEGVNERLRGWKRLVRAGEVSALRAVRLARYGSPLHLLRLCAVCALDEPWGKGDGVLRAPARAFLESYFPVPPAGGQSLEADAWRAYAAAVWKRWIERFWS